MKLSFCSLIRRIEFALITSLSVGGDTLSPKCRSGVPRQLLDMEFIGALIATAWKASLTRGKSARVFSIGYMFERVMLRQGVEERSPRVAKPCWLLCHGLRTFGA